MLKAAAGNDLVLILAGIAAAGWLLTAMFSALVRFFSKRRQSYEIPWWSSLLLALAMLCAVPDVLDSSGKRGGWTGAFIMSAFGLMVAVFGFVQGAVAGFRPFGQYHWLEGSASAPLVRSRGAGRSYSELERVLNRFDGLPQGYIRLRMNRLLQGLLGIVTYAVAMGVGAVCALGVSRVITAANAAEALMRILAVVVAFLVTGACFLLLVHAVARLLGWPERGEAPALAAVLGVNASGLLLMLGVWATR